ncbi:MAG TPA: energy transducer TonB [Usitatibacter sp.]|nr:energy transducer TonB [Usitatibacter sp.]
MDYAQSQRNPTKHLSGIAVVILLHLAIGYALVTGLARKVVEVIKAPIETKIIEEIKKPPPDLPPPPPPPKLAAPPPPFIPPPEINIQVPVVTPPPTITVQTTTPPPPQAFVPTPPVAPPAPPQPVVRREYKAAYRVEPSFPPQAIRQGLSGRVIAHVVVTPAGNVTEVRIIQSTNRLFDREVIRALSQWRFNPEPVGFIGEYEIVFNLKD